MNEGDIMEREGEENETVEPWWKKKKKDIGRYVRRNMKLDTRTARHVSCRYLFRTIIHLILQDE